MNPRAWLPLLLLLALTACQSAPQAPTTVGQPAPPARAPAQDWDVDGPPDHIPPGLEHLPDPVPRLEPKSARGNPASYTVFGRTYQTWDSAEGYYATGLASWYGRKFHGRSTSSGEPYDMLQLTAAHRSLPIPTYVRVTNLENGRSTLVRVNDRGPFHNDRIIDLSFAAAYKLGFAERGTARVRIESWAPPDGPGVRARADQQIADLPLERRYILQAGAFRNLAAADTLKDTLTRLTGERAYVVKVDNEDLYRVRLGPVMGQPEAERLRALIIAANQGTPIIIPD
ncbi:MAG: septal ring lytic transglycosylase RlpA family protein [Pseudomonadales bacterium]|nr:septal ring lytic transglycosylase RlpA family protein [Pseudomonadales bacterium]